MSGMQWQRISDVLYLQRKKAGVGYVLSVFRDRERFR